ncbi:hypothetical protein HRbin10_02306 [bacterium HR10]|nr:hypothetical protein HRbin10_02306 [bacterium HR10]
MREREQDTVVGRLLPRVESLVGAIADDALEQLPLLQRIAGIELGAIADVPIHASDQIGGVLRIAAAGIRRTIVADAMEDRERRAERPIAHRSRRARISSGRDEILPRDGRQSHQPRLQRPIALEEIARRGSGRPDELLRRDQDEPRRRTPHPNPLCTLEEEELVLLHRPADRVSELIAREDGLLDPIGIILEAIGCCGRDAIELVNGPMELVRPGLGGHIHDPGRSPPVLGREVVRDHAELLHGIERDALSHGGDELIVVRRAIEQDIGTSRPLPVDRHADTASGRIGRRDVPRRHHKRIRIARERGQLDDLPRINDLSDRLRLCVHQGSGLGHDLDLLHGSPDLQREVQGHARPHGHLHAPLGRSKPRSLDRHLIDGRKQIGHHIIPHLVRRRPTLRARHN